MKYLKIFEAFASEHLSKTLKYLRFEDSKRDFLDILTKDVQDKFDIPISEIDDSDIQIMPYEKAVYLQHPRQTKDATNIVEYKTIKWIKYWFSRDGAFLGRTVTDNQMCYSWGVTKEEIEEGVFVEPSVCMPDPQSGGGDVYIDSPEDFKDLDRWLKIDDKYINLTWNKNFELRVWDFLYCGSKRKEIFLKADFALVLDVEKIKQKNKNKSYQRLKDQRWDLKPDVVDRKAEFASKLSKFVKLDGGELELRKSIFKSLWGKWTGIYVFFAESWNLQQTPWIEKVCDYVRRNPIDKWSNVFTECRNCGDEKSDYCEICNGTELKDFYSDVASGIESKLRIDDFVNLIDNTINRLKDTENNILVKENWQLMKKIYEVIHKKFWNRELASSKSMRDLVNALQLFGMDIFEFGDENVNPRQLRELTTYIGANTLKFSRSVSKESIIEKFSTNLEKNNSNFKIILKFLESSDSNSLFGLN